MIGEEFILVYVRSEKEDDFNSMRNQYDSHMSNVCNIDLHL